MRPGLKAIRPQACSTGRENDTRVSERCLRVSSALPRRHCAGQQGGRLLETGSSDHYSGLFYMDTDEGTGYYDGVLWLAVSR